MAKKQAKKIHRSLFENLNFEPLTQTQSEALYGFEDGYNLVLTGYAGTGKTYLAIALALKALSTKQIKKIHIFRSAVASRDIGFLPGTEADKIAVYEKAIRNIFNELLRRGDAYDILKNSGVVTFNSTSFERGVTYKDAIVIVDECQNLSFQEIDTLVTRLHSSSRIVLCGDTRQSDLAQSRSGFGQMVRVVEKVPKYFSHHSFGVDDILRNEMIKAWIIAVEELYDS